MTRNPGGSGLVAPVRRSSEILRQEGWRALWFKFLGETVYRRVDVFEKRLADPVLQVSDRSDIEVSPLTVEAVDEFMEFRSYAPRDKVLERLAQGQLCYVARCNGRMVHCCWSTTGSFRLDYLGCDCQLNSDVVYFYESYTHPDYRGQSIAAFRSQLMQKHYRERGYRSYLAVSWPENHAAINAIYKSGGYRLGRMGYWGVGRFRHYFRKFANGAPPFQLLAGQEKSSRKRGEQYWNSVPPDFDASTHYLDPFLAELKRRENRRLVVEWGDPGPDSRILKTDAFEEAMGADSFLADLQRDNRRITGMDLSSEIARRARHNFGASGLRFAAADVRRLPFAPASFSLVVSPSTLDHFPDPSDLGTSLRELHRVMRPGARLVITLDNRQNLFDPLLRLVHWLGLVPYFLGRSYTVRQLREELIAAGFEVRKTTAILHNPRLMAVAMMRLVRWLRWRPLIRGTQKVMLAMQRLEHTRLCYYTGSFVAALAVRPEGDALDGEPG